MVQSAVEDKDFQALYYITYKKMATLEPDEIDFEDQYDKLDPIDDADLNKSMNERNESIREQEALESRITRAKWKSMDKNERTKLEQQIALNEESQYIMRASKTILSILHKGVSREIIQSIILHETSDHWSVAVLTVTEHFIYSHF